MYRQTAFLAALLLHLVVRSGGAWSADLKVLSPGSMENSLTAIAPLIRQASGHGITVSYGPAGVVANRVRQGEAVDVAILTAPATAELRKQGALVAGSETVVAKVGIGVFVRKGALKPDISSVEAFRSALANAKSIAYADPSLGGSTSILVGELMKSLDGDGAIRAKTRLTPPAQPLLDLMAGGGADFAFNPISEILPDARLELVGPLPAPIQKYTNYVASLVASGAQKDAAKALIDYLVSPAAIAIMTARGFEPR